MQFQTITLLTLHARQESVLDSKFFSSLHLDGVNTYLGIFLVFYFELTIKNNCLATTVLKKKKKAIQKQQLLSEINNKLHTERCMCRCSVLLRPFNTLYRIPRW